MAQTLPHDDAKDASDFIENFCSDGESINLGFDSVKSFTTSATSATSVTSAPGVTCVKSDANALKYDNLRSTADTIRLGTAYSTQMLQCLDQMLSQENEDVVKTLDDLVTDILCSVPYNSYSVALSSPLQYRKGANLANKKTN